MDEQRVKAYLQLIQALLSCDSGEEVAILSAHPELLDAGLVQVMQAVSERMAQQGRGNPNWLRNFANAIETANYSLTTLQKAEADRLLQQGIQQCKRNQFREALQSWQQSLTLYREVGDRSGEAKALGNLGNAYYSLGQVQRAIELYEQVLAIAREVGDRSGEAKALGNLGNAYYSLGQVQRAIELYEQVLAIAREIRQDLAIARDIRDDCSGEGITDDRSGEGITLGNLGNAYRSLGQMERAIEYYEQWLAIACEIGDPFGEGSALGNLGNAYRSLGEMQRAIEYYEQWLAIAREIGDPFGEGSALGNLGNAYRSLGQMQRAIEYYEQWLAIAREIGDRSGEGNALGNLGIAYSSLGEVQRAIEFSEQHLAIAREIGDPFGEGSALGNLGIAYSSLGQVQRALELYEQWLAIAREIGDRSGEGNALGNLGIAYRSLGQMQRAIELYEQRLAIAREIGDRSGEGKTLGNLGNAYSSLGQVQRALEFSEQHLAIARKIGDRSGEGRALGNLGLAYRNLQQIPQTLAAWKAGLEICPVRELPEEALFLARNLGNTAFDSQDWQTAIEGYDVAIEAVETLCSFEDSYIEKQKRREAEISVYEKLVQACIHAGEIGKALASVELSKSRNLIELLVNSTLEPTGDIPPEMREELLRLRREVTAKQRILESLDHPINPNPASDADFGQRRGDSPSFSPTAIETIRQEYVEAKRELNALLDRIKTYDPNFTLTQRVKWIQFSEIQGLLDEKTALIEWYLTRERIYAFVVTGSPQPPLAKGSLSEDGKISYAFVVARSPQPPLAKWWRSEDGKISVWVSTPENFTELQQLRQTYLDAYFYNKSQWRTDLDRFLQRLSDLLNLPELIARIPADYRQLILIPYRDLHLFPLHALAIDPATETQYLCDRFPDGVKYAPSCQFLQVSQRNQKTNPQNRFFAIQNPTGELTYADLEVEAILPAFHPNASRLTRQQATKTALSEHPHVGDFRSAEYLHFAGHGRFNFSNPLDSFLVLAGAVAGGESDSGRDAERFVSWRKGKSADLEKCYTLGELFQLNLPNCRLAILSACETGLVAFSPDLEEYISLGLGFLYAGATNVICSLWAVNDLSTAILMVKLYEELQTKPSISLALNRAQQWLRQVSVGELLKWSKSSASVTVQLQQEIEEEFELYNEEECYFRSPDRWAAFCAIGV